MYSIDREPRYPVHSKEDPGDPLWPYETIHSILFQNGVMRTIKAFFYKRNQFSIQGHEYVDILFSKGRRSPLLEPSVATLALFQVEEAGKKALKKGFAINAKEEARGFVTKQTKDLCSLAFDLN